MCYKNIENVKNKLLFVLRVIFRGKKSCVYLKEGTAYMKSVETGRYIAAKRKQQELTQKEFAEKLGTTEKMVSLWEKGKCMPDLSMCEKMCDILWITLNELFAGQDIEKEDIEKKSEENLIRVIKEHQNREIKMIRIVKNILTLIVIFLIVWSVLLVRCF